MNPCWDWRADVLKQNSSKPSKASLQKNELPWGASSVLARTHHALATARCVRASTLDAPYDCANPECMEYKVPLAPTCAFAVCKGVLDGLHQARYRRLAGLPCLPIAASCMRAL